MPTLTLTIKAPSADASEFSQAGNPQKALTNSLNLLRELASGLSLGSVDVQVSSADPVKASGTITCVFATLADTTSTVVISGVTLTCVTGTSDGVTQFRKITDLATTVTNLAATINANTTLNKFLSAAVTSAGVVTLTSHVAGVIGNQITLVGGTGATASAARLASGAGGAASAATTYGR